METNNIIETEIPMGTVHPAALEPYKVRFFVEDEIIQCTFGEDSYANYIFWTSVNSGL